MSLRQRTTCRACDGAIETFLALGDQPLANRLRRKDEPVTVPRYPLTLARCTQCDLVQLREVVDPAILFADYAYVPSTSSTMHRHFDELARTAVARLGLGASDRVVDVGSNDGLLLSAFKRHGTRVTGIEPAENLARRATENGIPTYCAFFSEDVARRVAADGPAALVCATNVFAHVDDIRGFLRAAALLLRPDGVFVAEVQSWADTVESLAFDMTYHEHMTYYATAPLAAMCAREGLELLDVDRVSTHGGSLRAWIGRPGHAIANPGRVADRIDAERPSAGAAGCAQMAAGVEQLRGELRTMLRDIRLAGGTVAGYGAPAKATVLLNYCALTRADVAWVADKNEAKQGHFIPGADVPVVPPDRIRTDAPSHLLLLAWNLAEEIAAEQAEYVDAGGKLVVPVPHPRLIG
jgi:SAM-dependent methyltransferase